MTNLRFNTPVKKRDCAIVRCVTITNCQTPETGKIPNRTWLGCENSEITWTCIAYWKRFWITYFYRRSELPGRSWFLILAWVGLISAETAYSAATLCLARCITISELLSRYSPPKQCNSQNKSIHWVSVEDAVYVCLSPGIRDLIWRYLRHSITG